VNDIYLDLVSKNGSERTEFCDFITFHVLAAPLPLIPKIPWLVASARVTRGLFTPSERIQPVAVSLPCYAAPERQRPALVSSAGILEHNEPSVLFSPYAKKTFSQTESQRRKSIVAVGPRSCFRGEQTYFLYIRLQPSEEQTPTW